MERQQFRNSFSVLVIILAISQATIPGQDLRPEAKDSEEYPGLCQSKEVFKQYLAKPYAVRRVTYRCLQDGKNTDGTTNATITADGVLAEDTFYHRYKSENPEDLTFFHNSISGQSSNGVFWSIDGESLRGTGGSVQMALPQSSEYTQATSQSVSGLQELRGVCWFGLRMLVPGSLIWNGDAFTAQWYNNEWPRNTNTLRITGEVLGYTNSLPLVIQLKSADWPKNYRYVEVHYEYGFATSSRCYPSKIWSEAVLDTGRARGQSFDDIQIEFGHADIPNDGYLPKDFLPSTDSTPSMSLIASNKGVFLDQDGKLSEVQLAADAGAIKTVQPRTGRSLLLFFIALSCLLTLIFAIQRQVKNKEGKTRRD